MGQWAPTQDSLYRSILDQCLEVFEISKPLENFVCFGDPAGRNCTCAVQVNDYWFWMKTPQQLGLPISPAFQELDSWSRSGRFWTRKTAVLHVGRLVDNDAEHLDWVEPEAIARGFGIPASVLDIAHATKTLTTATATAGWSSPELRTDGSFNLLKTNSTDPRAIRFYHLFIGEDYNIFAGEALTALGIPTFDFPRGYRSDLSVAITTKDMLTGKRFETLVYEFDLCGSDSWNFQVSRRR